MMKLRIILTVIGVASCLLFTQQYFYAANIGSSTTIQKQAIPADPGNTFTVLEGAWCAAGLTVSGATVTFGSLFPVSGPISFTSPTNTLALLSNLNLGDNTTNINSMGNINAAGNVFALSQSTTFFPITGTGATYTFSNLKFAIDANTKINNSALLFTGNSIIDGGGLNLDLAGTSSIIVGSNSTLLLRQVHLNNVHGTMIRCLDNTGTISCTSGTSFLLDGDISFTVGKIYVTDDLLLTGTHIFTYRSTESIFLDSDANVILDFGLTFSYDPLNNNPNLIQFANGGQITLNGATMYATSGGQKFLKATILVTNRSYLACEGTSTANAMIFGDGVNTLNNVNVIARADLEILRGVVIDNDAR